MSAADHLYPTYHLREDLDAETARWLRGQQGDGPLDLPSITDVCAGCGVRATLRDERGADVGVVDERGDYLLQRDADTFVRCGRVELCGVRALHDESGQVVIEIRRRDEAEIEFIGYPNLPWCATVLGWHRGQAGAYGSTPLQAAERRISGWTLGDVS